MIEINKQTNKWDYKFIITASTIEAYEEWDIVKTMKSYELINSKNAVKFLTPCKFSKEEVWWLMLNKEDFENLKAEIEQEEKRKKEENERKEAERKEEAKKQAEKGRKKFEKWEKVTIENEMSDYEIKQSLKWDEDLIVYIYSIAKHNEIDDVANEDNTITIESIKNFLWEKQKKKVREENEKKEEESIIERKRKEAEQKWHDVLLWIEDTMWDWEIYTYVKLNWQTYDLKME